MKKRIIILSTLLAFLLGASIGAVAYMKKTAANGALAYIYRDNELIKTVDLENVAEPYEFTIEYGGGDFNVIEVRKGSIGIIEASCPDHLCMNMGFISDSLMPITCLPNHLIIRVEGKGDGNRSELDGVVY